MNLRSKKIIGNLLIAFVLIGVLTFVLKKEIRQIETREVVMNTDESREPHLRVNDLRIPVEIASTTKAIEKGLSGREALPEDRGMLFLFSKPDLYRFWMPDMNFPLDMIWINNGKIVHIHKNVTHEFNPADPVFYSPSSPAQFVLEVNAGFSEKHHISVGDIVMFNNI